MSDTEKEPLLLVNADLTPAETEEFPEPDIQNEDGDTPVSPQPDKAQTLPRTNRQLSFSFQERSKTLPNRQTSDEKTRILDQSFGGTTCYGSMFMSWLLL